MEERAPPLLAIVRIVAVLGMSFAIAVGIFLLLWGKLALGFLAILAAVPFFAAMRFMEKSALRDIDTLPESDPKGQSFPP